MNDESNDEKLDKLVSNGTIKSYNHELLGEKHGDYYDRLTIEFLNGEMIEIVSGNVGCEAGSMLYIR